MNLFHNSECLNGLYFYPRFDKEKWKAEWIDAINKEIKTEIIPAVSRYVAIQHKPELLFLHSRATGSLRRELRLPRWVRAFTHNNRIYIFFSYRNKKWKTHLKHEIFHAGVNQVCGNKKIIPDWFNEAIAYYLSQDRRIPGKVKRYIRSEGHRIISHFNTDSFIDSDLLYQFHIIKTFGMFFVANYGAGTVRQLISRAAETGDFKQAADQCDASLFRHWIEWLAKN